MALKGDVQEMNSKATQSLIIACLGTVLSVLAAFIGAGLTGWVLHVHEYGMRAPEMFGWVGAFILFGIVALIGVAPSLLVILACGIVWQTPLGRHALLSVVLPLFLGGFAMAVYFMLDLGSVTLSCYIIAGSLSLMITSIVEAILRKWLQNIPLHGTRGNARR